MSTRRSNPQESRRRPAIARTLAAAACVYVPLLDATAAPSATAPVVASSLWNGRWIEILARSTIFVPGTIRITEVAPGRDRLDGDAPAVVCGRGPVTCRPENTDTLRLTWTEKHAVTDNALWHLSNDDDTLTISEWTTAPDGTRMADTDTYVRVDCPTLDTGPAGRGFPGRWRRTGSTETPTTYTLTIEGSRLHVVANAGQVAFVAPLGGGTSLHPLTAESGNTYTVLASRHLLETTFRKGRAVAHSDLTLDPTGTGFVERHVDAQGHVVTLFFARR